MANPFHPTIVFLLFVAVIPYIDALLFTKEDRPSLLDQVLQVVWEPSSLIRMWVGLDQLFNIVRSWRGVAKRLVALPLGDDGSMAHVRIQEPRSFKYAKPSVASQWDRFNKIYSSSNLSPLVAHARAQQIYPQSNIISNTDIKPVVKNAQDTLQAESSSGLSLPPLFLFQPQEVFLDQEIMDALQNGNNPGQSTPFENRDDPSKLLDMQKQETQNTLQGDRYANQFGGIAPLFPSKMDYENSILNLGPQERLNMFLKLLKNLGDIHKNSIAENDLEPSHDEYENF